VIERNVLVHEIRGFLSKIEHESVSESALQRAMKNLENLLPHSDISDIVFYGERERTAEEMADEALLRERLWLDGGAEAVTAHIVEEMRAALADPTREVCHHASATTILAGIERQAQRDASRSNVQ